MSLNLLQEPVLVARLAQRNCGATQGLHLPCIDIPEYCKLKTFMLEEVSKEGKKNKA